MFLSNVKEMKKRWFWEQKICSTRFSREETMNESAIQTSELRELGTLEGLPTDRLDHLGRNMEELRVGKGQSIYRPGQPAKYLYYVLEG